MVALLGLQLLLQTVFLASAIAFVVPLSGSKVQTGLRNDLVGLDVDSIDQARTAFFVWFFGASGAAGIARSAFPRMYSNAVEIGNLKGVGPTKGGPTAGISPLCGYPEDIAVADLQQILKNNQSVEQIVKKNPVENNFLSAQGYLTYSAFQSANPNANPLALRAIFDSLNTNADVCNPQTAQELLDQYEQDLGVFKNKLLQAKLQVLCHSSFAIFARPCRLRSVSGAFQVRMVSCMAWPR